MFCTNCGNKVSSDEVYCIRCGNKIQGEDDGGYEEKDTKDKKDLNPAEYQKVTLYKVLGVLFSLAVIPITIYLLNILAEKSYGHYNWYYKSQAEIPTGGAIGTAIAALFIMLVSYALFGEEKKILKVKHTDPLFLLLFIIDVIAIGVYIVVGLKGIKLV